MNEMYCAEQIQIPSELGTVLKLLTKSSIRDKPQDVYKWAANYFAEQCNRSPAFDGEGKLTPAGKETMPASGAFTRGMQRKPSVERSPKRGGAATEAAAAAAGGAEGRQEGGAEGEEISPEEEQARREEEIVDALFDKYDPQRTNLIAHAALPSLILDMKFELGLDFTTEQMEEFVNSMAPDEEGQINLDDFRVSFFQG